MNNRDKEKQVLLFIIPLVLSIIASIISSLWLGVVAIVLMMALVLFLPLCYHYENVYMFVSNCIIALPLNIRLVIYAMDRLDISDSKVFIALCSITSIFILISLEGIALGVVARVVKPSQYDFDE